MFKLTHFHSHHVPLNKSNFKRHSPLIKIVWRQIHVAILQLGRFTHLSSEYDSWKISQTGNMISPRVSNDCKVDHCEKMVHPPSQKQLYLPENVCFAFKEYLSVIRKDYGFHSFNYHYEYIYIYLRSCIFTFVKVSSQENVAFLLTFCYVLNCGRTDSFEKVVTIYI